MRSAGASRTIVLALSLFVFSDCRKTPSAASRAATESVVQCLPYRPCGCFEGCAGIAVRREDLRLGLRASSVAGMACGREVLVEPALAPDGRQTFVLGTGAECDYRCRMTALRAVDPSACAGRCDACAADAGRAR